MLAGSGSGRNGRGLGRNGTQPSDQSPGRTRPLAGRFLCAAGRRRAADGAGDWCARNRLGEVPLDRPVHFQEVLATVYHHLGVDPDATTLPDLNGRPRYLVDDCRPIPELL